MKKIILSVLATSALMAGGYKIPEVSTNGVALSAANVAHNKSADAAYYNPANMVFMKHDGLMEIGAMYVGLSDVKYKGDDHSSGPYNMKSSKEDFFIPSFHYVSPEIAGARLGFSMVVPAGLSKRWSEQPAEASAEEFTLETIEFNPTIAIPIGDKIGIAVGFRGIYSKGKVKGRVPGAMKLNMDGTSMDYGYNLAMSYKPLKELELALTYRSKVNIGVQGDADVFHAYYIPSKVKTDVSVDIPIPAALNAAIAYTFPTKTTIEFVYERTYWHSYSNINFQYHDATAEAVFGNKKDKNWDDTSTYRLGITQELDALTLMCGVVRDETPVPESTADYSLPDSDSTSVSLGARYQITDKMNIGLAGLYSMRDDRVVHNDELDGEFTDSNVLMISAGLEYRF